MNVSILDFGMWDYMKICDWEPIFADKTRIREHKF